MTTSTCHNCGAGVELRKVNRVRGGIKVEEMQPVALSGQRARAGLPVHLTKCPECGAPRPEAEK